MDQPIPSPAPSDDEEVSWALSTATALWSRGERAEALKWLRRAAEHASDANLDTRALELFKAAADVSTRLSALPPPPATPSSPPPGRASSLPSPPARGSSFPAPPVRASSAPSAPAQSATPPSPPARGSSLPSPPVRGSSVPAAPPVGGRSRTAVYVVPSSGPVSSGAATVAAPPPPVPPVPGAASAAPIRSAPPLAARGPSRPAPTEGVAATLASAPAGFARSTVPSPEPAPVAPKQASGRASSPALDAGPQSTGRARSRTRRGTDTGRRRTIEAEPTPALRASATKPKDAPIGRRPAGGKGDAAPEPRAGGMFPDDEITQTHAFTNVEIREMLPPEPSVVDELTPKLAPSRRDAASATGQRALRPLDDLDEDTRVLDGKGKRGFDNEFDEAIDGVTGAGIPAMPLDDAMASTEPDRRSKPGGAPSSVDPQASTERGGRPATEPARDGDLVELKSILPAVRVALLPGATRGELRAIALADGAHPPAGAAHVILVPLTVADGVAVARMLGKS
ncbi:MAG TPA: hypothetical protein VGM56_16970 [Byssovorax sp.]|jgi:hypothetical protein